MARESWLAEHGFLFFLLWGRRTGDFGNVLGTAIVRCGAVVDNAAGRLLQSCFPANRD